jgi:LmbE family N-acetylglucosaminyl deacetylase
MPARVPPAARPARVSLFVFAHQDDECLLSTRIAREREAGRRVLCAYLTSGAGPRASSATRDAESRRVLARLGVRDGDAHFLGSADGLPDGELALHLPRALRLLEEALGGQPVHRVFCMAYEGGHADHDASHVVAWAFARRRGLLGRSWQMPAYHGHGLPGPLFRTMSPLAGRRRVRVRRLPRGLAWRHAFLCWRYPSQWRTWMGLFPELLLQRGLRRREVLMPVDGRALRGVPHPGTPFYERRFGFAYADFRAGADAFLDAEGGAEGGPPGTWRSGRLRP